MASGGGVLHKDQLSNYCRFTGGSPAKSGTVKRPPREQPSALSYQSKHGAARKHLGNGDGPYSCSTPSPTALVSEGVFGSMGWQQYSCQLWLSRVNPYILYLKGINCGDAWVADCFSTDASKSQLSRCCGRSYGAPTDIRFSYVPLASWPGFLGRAHGDVDVLEDLTPLDATAAIG